MHAMVAKAIEARRAQKAGARADLLDYMIRAKDPDTGRTMSAQDLLHNMQFFIVAGHETTALALSWALYLLANDKAAQERAREEARGVLGERAATAEDLAAMPFAEQVLEEAMRLYPPVGFLARNVLERDKIYDRQINPRETVFINIHALHRHRMLWDRPGAFDPDHFSAEEKSRRDRYSYLPFGAGPRICVGANFAMMQAQIILSTLLARFRFAPGGPDPTPIMHMTIRPDPGVFLEVHSI
jgi:cytochrome P450